MKIEKKCIRKTNKTIKANSPTDYIFYLHKWFMLFLCLTNSPGGLCEMWPSAPLRLAHWWCHVCVGGASSLPTPLAGELHANSAIWCWYTEYSAVIIIILNQCLPPQSTTTSTPNPPVSSRTTDSRSDAPLYTGITLAVQKHGRYWNICEV